MLAIQSASREIEQSALVRLFLIYINFQKWLTFINWLCSNSYKNADQAVKVCLLRTTNLFHAIRLLEKEYNSVFKLISSFQAILASIEETSSKVELDLIRLEEAFEEKARLNACRDEERALLEDESDIGITKI